MQIHNYINFTINKNDDLSYSFINDKIIIFTTEPNLKYFTIYNEKGFFCTSSLTWWCYDFALIDKTQCFELTYLKDVKYVIFFNDQIFFNIKDMWRYISIENVLDKNKIKLVSFRTDKNAEYTFTVFYNFLFIHDKIKNVWFYKNPAASVQDDNNPEALIIIKNIFSGSLMELFPYIDNENNVKIILRHAFAENKIFYLSELKLGIMQPSNELLLDTIHLQDPIKQKLVASDINNWDDGKITEFCCLFVSTNAIVLFTVFNNCVLYFSKSKEVIKNVVNDIFLFKHKFQPNSQNDLKWLSADFDNYYSDPSKINIFLIYNNNRYCLFSKKLVIIFVIDDIKDSSNIKVYFNHYDQTFFIEIFSQWITKLNKDQAYYLLIDLISDVLENIIKYFSLNYYNNMGYELDPNKNKFLNSLFHFFGDKSINHDIAFLNKLNKYKSKWKVLYRKYIERVNNPTVTFCDKQTMNYYQPVVFKPALGKKHLLSSVIDEITNIFYQLNFSKSDLTSIESEDEITETWAFNFHKLNIPKNNLPEYNQDTFLINEHLILRTHCTNITARTLEFTFKKHLANITNFISSGSFTIGSVFRRDTEDFNHTHQFTQLDAFVVAKNNTFCNMSHLKWLINEFCRLFFQKPVKLNFRSSFFPFTIPSIEVDIWSEEKQAWFEILGAGLIHPQVLINCDLNCNEMCSQKCSKHYNVVGLALGIGIERLILLKYPELNKDIRSLYDFSLQTINQE